jgi:hypothetical protein
MPTDYHSPPHLPSLLAILGVGICPTPSRCGKDALMRNYRARPVQPPVRTPEIAFSGGVEIFLLTL